MSERSSKASKRSEDTQLRTGRGSVILPYFLKDGLQRHITGQSIQTCPRQFGHGATDGASQGLAVMTPGGIDVV